MTYRRCGVSGPELPVLGVGCWAFGGGEYWGEQAQTDVDDVVACALDAGCCYFDTAEAYNKGASEVSLGTALKGRRSEAIVGSKVSPSNAYASTLVEHCEASLRRLRMDYVDIYMVHWPLHSHSVRHFTDDDRIINNPPSVSEAFETLTKLRDQGKIRWIGVSNFGARWLTEAIRYAEVVVDELPYSLLTRAIEREMLPHCRAAGIGVIGYMTLLQGLLADVYAKLDDVPTWQRRTRHFRCEGSELCRHGGPGFEAETDRAISEIARIARAHSMSVPEIAIKWVIASRAVTCALVGARNRREMEANLRAAQEPLPAGVREELNSATDDLAAKLGPSFDYYESEENDRSRWVGAS